MTEAPDLSGLVPAVEAWKAWPSNKVDLSNVRSVIEMMNREPEGDPTIEALLLYLVRRGVLIGVDVFGGMEDEDWGYGLCDVMGPHSVGSDCNRADAFLLRPADGLMTDALRAAITAEGTES